MLKKMFKRHQEEKDQDDVKFDLKKDMELVERAKEQERIAYQAFQKGEKVQVPKFEKVVKPKNRISFADYEALMEKLDKEGRLDSIKNPRAD